MAEALLRGTVLTTLCHPQALTPTPINTYEYWQRPAISIITFQDCVSASATDNFRSQQVRVSVGLLFSPPSGKTCKLILLAPFSIT